jgi:rhodanese-related sulfurtransferase
MSRDRLPSSVMAYDRLVESGYSNVWRYAGGLEDWEAAGLPLAGEPVRPE